ncbi:hypothetical protein KR018_004622, partial [Drosophila ironensis]
GTRRSRGSLREGGQCPGPGGSPNGVAHFGRCRRSQAQRQ